MVKDSIDLAEKMGVLGAGFIPKNDVTTCNANSKGLFAYYRAADTGFSLTCRMPDGTGSGWAGTTGVKDVADIDAKSLTAVAANKALKSRKAKAIEPGRYTVILEPRANARFLSLLLGIFNPNGPGSAAAGRRRWSPACRWSAGGRALPAAPLARRRRWGRRRRRRTVRRMRRVRRASYMAGKKVGDKLFSDLFTLKSDVGNQILRQTTILNDNKPAKPVTWVENGVLQARSARIRARTRTRRSCMEGIESLDRRHGQANAPRSARHAVLVHPRRAVAGAAAPQHRHDARRICFSSRTARSSARCRTSAGTCRRSSATRTYRSSASRCRWRLGEAFGAGERRARAARAY